MLFEKLKESLISVLPIMCLVIILHFSIASLGAELWKFLLGGGLLILGLAIFLVGVDIGVLPVGQKTGAALTSRRNLYLLLITGFITGFFITVAEPDVWVLANQVMSVDRSINAVVLVCIIAVGVGLFTAIAMGRILLNASLKLLLALFYLIVFICAYLTSPIFVGIGFDAGGATTGPMTVPFVMALGVGIAAVRGDRSASDDSFGFVGMASVGPVLAVLIMGIFLTGQAPTNTLNVTSKQELSLIEHFLDLVPEVTKEVGTALGPLIVLFLVFQIFLLKMPQRQFRRIIKGLIYTSFGLVCFFIGVKGGFIPVGSLLGQLLALNNINFLLPLGFIFGAVVVCAEPAVWVLTEQVEKVSGGNIPRLVMLIALSLGVAVAVGLSMLRVETGLSLWYFLVPGYALAMLLMRFCPQMFTAIAFDSGGVASGPMASTFILSFSLGASNALGGNPILDAFGVISLIAMTPLIAIQILGIIFQKKMQKNKIPPVNKAQTH